MTIYNSRGERTIASPLEQTQTEGFVLSSPVIRKATLNPKEGTLLITILKDQFNFEEQLENVTVCKPHSHIKERQRISELFTS